MHLDQRRKKCVFITVFFACYVLYLVWRAAYTIPLDLGWASVLFGAVLYIAELVGFFESVVFYITLWNTDTPCTPDVKGKEYPDVDVFIATYNEPLELLYKTLVGCKNMDYPDKKKVHIYACDDGNRKELADLCQRLRIGYITRTEHVHAKAGNLNHALSQTDSPYVVTFDADMIPMHDFLMKTIPFFLSRERVGFVQVPQNFYNPDPFQYNLFSENSIPNEQDLFSRLLQAGKNRFNAIIYAGSNTVISREALDEIGGLVEGTITEDFATGMKIQSKGYRTFYLNEVHASGLSPENLEDLYNQRIRWGRGVVQTFKSFNPSGEKGLTIIQKVMYASALSYWYFGIWRFIYFLAPVMYSLFGVVVLKASAFSILKIWLPVFLLSYIMFKVFSDNVRTLAWSHIYDTIMFPQIIAGVLMETFGFKLSQFKVTPKDSITRKSFVNKFRLVRLQICLAVLSLLSLGKLLYLTAFYGFSVSYIMNFLWLAYNLYLLSMAIFFSSERPKFRTSERQLITADAFIMFDGKVTEGTTCDIAENGVSVVFKKPFFLEPEDTHKVVIVTDRYSAQCDAQLVRVDHVSDGYKYVFQFVTNESNYQQLLGILYDRVPVAPRRIQKDVLWDNVKKNMKQRRKPFYMMNRKLPRIPVDRDIIAYANRKQIVIHMEDYNYVCCRVKAHQNYAEMIIPLDKNGRYEMKCVLAREYRDAGGAVSYIYDITNYKELTHLDINAQFIASHSISEAEKILQMIMNHRVM